MTDLPPTDLTPMQMVQAAVSGGFDLDRIRALIDLEREWKADRAREALTAALIAFRSEAIEIKKTRRVAFKDVRYSHAQLDEIVDAVTPMMSKHGLAHRW